MVKCVDYGEESEPHKKGLLPHLPRNRRLRVCLFGGEIGWMENFEDKIGRETFLERVWLGGEEGK